MISNYINIVALKPDQPLKVDFITIYTDDNGLGLNKLNLHKNKNKICCLYLKVILV